MHTGVQLRRPSQVAALKRLAVLLGQRPAIYSFRAPSAAEVAADKFRCGLDRFLERNRDRELFGMEPR